LTRESRRKKMPAQPPIRPHPRVQSLGWAIGVGRVATGYITPLVLEL